MPTLKYDFHKKLSQNASFCTKIFKNLSGLPDQSPDIMYSIHYLFYLLHIKMDSLYFVY